jgi:hypothetical protein
MKPHWSGYLARDGHYPDPDTKQCFADEEDAVKYLAGQLATAEAKENAAEPTSVYARDWEAMWEREEEYREGFAELEDRMCDMTRGDKDPADWIGMGPAVLVRGIDYVMEGCAGEDCNVQPAAVHTA